MADNKREIKKIKIELQTLYNDVPTSKHKLAETLIDNIAFMIYQLSVLRGQINEFGLVYEYKNGRQEVTAESPYSKAYNSMIVKYLATVKQLNELLPTGSAKTVSEIDQFLHSRSG